MQLLRFLPPLALALLLAGCVLSREPFYTADTVAAAPALAGKWRLIGKDGAPEEDEYWTFADGKAQALDERGQWRTLKLTWFRLGGADFVDSVAEGPGDDITASEAYRSLHLVPFHMLSKVERSADRLILRPLLTREFSQATGKKPIAGWIEQTDYETYVFNASPGDWAAFLAAHGADGGLFSEESKLVFVRQE